MNSWISRNDSIYGPLGLVLDSFIGHFLWVLITWADWYPSLVSVRLSCPCMYSA